MSGSGASTLDSKFNTLLTHTYMVRHNPDAKEVGSGSISEHRHPSRDQLSPGT